MNFQKWELFLARPEFTKHVSMSVAKATLIYTVMLTKYRGYKVIILSMIGEPEKHLEDIFLNVLHLSGNKMLCASFMQKIPPRFSIKCELTNQ